MWGLDWIISSEMISIPVPFWECYVRKMKKNDFIQENPFMKSSLFKLEKSQWKRTVLVGLVPSIFAKNVPVFVKTFRKMSKTVEWNHDPRKSSSIIYLRMKFKMTVDLIYERKLCWFYVCIWWRKWLAKVYLIHEYRKMINHQICLLHIQKQPPEVFCN